MLLSRLDLRLAALALAAGLLAGCGPRGEIKKYTVEKPELVDPLLAAAAPSEVQLLGAMVSVGDTGWFFKLMGDPAAVTAARPAFVDFLKGVKFSAGENPQPTWTLPAGWEEAPGNQFRFATLKFTSAGKPLEITVSSAGGDALGNVNRWRDQVSLPPIASEQLQSVVEKVPVDGREAMLVSFVGVPKSGGMGGAPFAPFAGGAPPAAGPVGPAASEAAASGIKYDAPAEWSAGRVNQFRKAAFNIESGGQKAEVTVIDLPADAPGSGWAAQVNRWRGQVKLEPASDAEIAKETKKIETLGVTGDYVEVVGPQGDAILAVMAVTGDKAWFIKLTGPRELATAEKPRFEAFVKSLKLK